MLKCMVIQPYFLIYLLSFYCKSNYTMNEFKLRYLYSCMNIFTYVHTGDHTYVCMCMEARSGHRCLPLHFPPLFEEGSLTESQACDSARLPG